MWIYEAEAIMLFRLFYYIRTQWTFSSTSISLHANIFQQFLNNNYYILYLHKYAEEFLVLTHIQLNSSL